MLCSRPWRTVKESTGGDRSGTVFKVSRERQIYVFATIEPSIAAYHFAFGNDGYLYVAGPTTSSFDAVNRISPAGEVEMIKEKKEDGAEGAAPAKAGDKGAAAKAPAAKAGDKPAEKAGEKKAEKKK